MSFTSGQCTGLASDGLGEGIPDDKETTSSTLYTEYSYSTYCVYTWISSNGTIFQVALDIDRESRND